MRFVLALEKKILSLYCHLFVEKTIEIYLIRKKLSVNIHRSVIMETELRHTHSLWHKHREVK